MRVRLFAWLARFACRLWFVVIILPAIEKELGAQAPPPQRVEHHFVVPDSSARVLPYLPLSGEYIPPEIYERWWHEIAACEGLELPVDHYRIRFWQVNAVHFYDRDRPSLFWKDGQLWVHWALGISYLNEGVIFIAVPYRLDEIAVKHEMLHFLIMWNRVKPGEDHHPMPYFAQCGMSVVYEKPKS